ncbi:MAG TPA: SLBB domain-containing protein [Rubricoccaceae bacterium]|jgi:hypothetical protein
MTTFSMRLALLLLILAPLAASAQPASSQTPPPADPPLVTRLGQSEQTRSNSTGYYYNHLPGEATIQVQVEGTVAYPGLYEVGVGTDLRRVLALAGGPRLDVRDRDSDRRVDIQLLRPSEGAIYVSTLAAASIRPDLIPALRHDDTVLVDVISRRRFTIQDAATIIGALGTFGFLIQAVAR